MSSLLFLSLTGTARFPAVVRITKTEYPRDYTDDGSFAEVTKCSGIPYIYRSCTTQMVPGPAESEESGESPESEAPTPR